LNTKATLSRREMIAKTLRSARRGKIVVAGNTVKTTGGWVDGTMITHPEVGGDSGLRRLRELRAHGMQIEKRYNADAGVFQYRLGR
jgi:hypothetical protein